MMKLLYLYIFLTMPFFGIAGENLQSLVNKAKNSGVLELESTKTYTLDKPLKLPSKFKLNGNGALVEPSIGWRKANGNISALIEIVNVSNVSISNLIIDNKGNRGISGMPTYSILILNSSIVNISRNSFKNLGVKNTSSSTHGSPFILLVAQESNGDFTYLPSEFRNVKGSVNNVDILNNVFENKEYVNSFAIRLLTLWTKKRSKENIQNKVSQVRITGNKFLGEYDWNTVEMAGPGTVSISVENNNFSGKSINNIDVDKGASNIVIKNNTLTNLGLPNRHRSDPNVRVSPIMIHGNTGGYYCENVDVIGNSISGIRNPNIKNSRYLYSSGIGVLHSKNVKVLNNRITNVFPGQSYGGGICLDQSIYDITVENNIIEDANWGIIITPNSKTFNNITIENNKINANSEPMILMTGKEGTFNNLSVKGNNVSSRSSKKIKLSKTIKNLSTDVR